MTLDEFLSRLDKVSGSKNQYYARCPAHDDNHASLCISTGENGPILVNCKAGCKTPDIMAALNLKMSDLFQRSPAPTQSSKPQLVAQYEYTDLAGNIVCKKLRYSNKSFCWLHPDSSGGWAKGRNGAAPIFNQFHAQNVQTMYFVEGEKDVLTLKAHGRAAVSLPDGAQSKWRSEYTDFFRGRTVAIIPDNDEPGKKFAEMAAEKLRGVAQSVKVLDLSQIWQGIPNKADISDYLAAFPDGMPAVSSLAEQTAEWMPGAAEGEPPKRKYTKLSNVESTNTEWLWYPYIPLGKITLMNADPGTGKTFFSLYLTATVSTGNPFYGEDSHVNHEPAVAIYQTAEDGISDTIKPRLETMTVNFNNVYFIDESEEPLSLSESYDDIERAMKELKPRLMIFDPLQAYLGANVDMHRANEVRPVLSRIGHLAEKYNCAVIFIMHNSKTGQNKALFRALGSIDIPAVARSMLTLGKNPDNKKQVVMCHEKSSLAEHGQSILFSINPELGGVVFEGFSELNADDVLNPRMGTRKKPSVCKEEAADALLDLLGEDGYATLDDVQTLQYAMGFSERTLYNAKKDLALESVSLGFGKTKKTWWLAPDVDKEKFILEQKHRIATENPEE